MSILVGLVTLSASPAGACNTPVYRYAMYNWAPAPYFVFYLHRGDPPAEDQKVNGMLTEMAQTGPKVANLVLEPADVSGDEFEKFPEPVKEAWRSHSGQDAEKAEPLHLVFTYWGAKLHVGRLDEAAVRAMVGSPARTRIGELLGDGFATVMVFLPGSDAAENERAEQVARDVIAQAAAGEIPVESGLLDARFSLPPPPSDSADDADSQPARTEEELVAELSKLKVGLVKLDRADAAEQWLVRALTVIEPDLEELKEQPMVFFTFGRGRAMPPYVGKGITRENLSAEIQFLASACSCTVKEQNPGVDLLMHWDWDATADAMAESDPSMNGGLFGYQEFSPDEMGGSAPSVDPETTAEVASTVAGLPAEAAETLPAEPEATQGPEAPQPPQAGSAAEKQPQTGRPTPAVEEPSEDVAAVTVAMPEIDQGGSFAVKQVWMFGIGLAAVAVVVVFAGLVLILRRTTPGERALP